MLVKYAIVTVANLNTSNVTVNQPSHKMKLDYSKNLNTSNVTVNQKK